MSANGERFEERFSEWLTVNNTLAVQALGDNVELVRAIAGLFYFEGAIDANQAARSIIADTYEVGNAS